MKNNNITLKILILLAVYFLTSSNISIDYVPLKENQSGNAINIFDETFLNSFYEGEVNIYKLKQNYSDYGEVAWLNRSSSKRIKVKYFASGNAYKKYDSWKNNNPYKKVILVSVGAYSKSFSPDASNIPIGLTIDNGTIINSSFVDAQMDGLAIVYATGGVVVSNLNEKNLFVGEPLNQIMDLRNSTDREIFINWCVSQSATIFQTHLLGWKNYINFNKTDAEKKNSRIDSRRLLALVKEINSGNIYYVVFNITKEVKLWDASNEALSYLKNQRNMDVIALLNLDAGAFDCLSTFDNNGRELSYMKGKQNISFPVTTNLIVFYRD